MPESDLISNRRITEYTDTIKLRLIGSSYKVSARGWLEKMTTTDVVNLSHPKRRHRPCVRVATGGTLAHTFIQQIANKNPFPRKCGQADREMRTEIHRRKSLALRSCTAAKRKHSPIKEAFRNSLLRKALLKSGRQDLNLRPSEPHSLLARLSVGTSD
jgi:hypothetical protein